MGQETGIAWCDATVNFWQGCHKLSAGCSHCYMFSEKTRYGQNPNIVVRSSDTTFNAPLKWAKNREKYAHINRVFVNSWSDFFIEESDPWRAEAWEIMRKTPNLVYILCTKRPERIRQSLPSDWEQGYPNVWLLTSTENQEAADLRIPILLSIPAVVHGISAEPLLGPIDLKDWIAPMRCLGCGYVGFEDDDECPSCGASREYEYGPIEFEAGISGSDKKRLGWAIVGGESGPHARPMDPAWARSLRDQCKETGVSFFMKQGSAANWKDFKNFDALPEDLQIREFPGETK